MPDLIDSRRRRWLTAVAGGAAAIALTGPMLARAGEATRVEYREAADPICRTNAEANERILAGTRREVRHGELKRAAAKLTGAARALKGTARQLKALPRPAADRTRLAKWFRYIDEEVAYFDLAARHLRADDRAAASRDVVRLTSTAKRANAQVVPFEFAYCRLEPSRFT